MSRTIPSQSTDRTIPDQAENGSGADLTLGDAVYNDEGVVKPVLGDGTQVIDDEVQPIIGDGAILNLKDGEAGPYYAVDANLGQAVEVDFGTNEVIPILSTGTEVYGYDGGEGMVYEVRPILGDGTTIFGDEIVPNLGTGTRVVGNEVLPNADYRQLEIETITLNFTNQSAMNFKVLGDGTRTVCGFPATITNSGAPMTEFQLTNNGRLYYDSASGYSFWQNSRQTGRIEWDLSTGLSSALTFGDLVSVELAYDPFSLNGLTGFPNFILYCLPGISTGTNPLIHVANIGVGQSPATSGGLGTYAFPRDTAAAYDFQAASGTYNLSSNIPSPLRLEYLAGLTRVSCGGTNFSNATLASGNTTPLRVGFGGALSPRIGFISLTVTVYRGYLSLV